MDLTGSAVLVTHGGLAATQRHDVLAAARGVAELQRFENVPGLGQARRNGITVDSGIISCEGTVVSRTRRVATAQDRVTDTGGRLLGIGTTACLLTDLRT